MCPLTEGTKNAEFTGHRDFGQNTQDKEGGNKANSMAAATLLCMWVGLLHTRCNNLFGDNSFTVLEAEKEEKLEDGFFFFSKAIFNNLQAAIYRLECFVYNL